MDDRPNDPVRLDIDRKNKPEFRDLTVPREAGLLADRELDDAPG